MDKVKCPMLTMYAITFKKPEEYEDRDCLKQECAWWVTRELAHGIIWEGCAILALVELARRK